MTEQEFLQLKAAILTMLREKLDPRLTYHSPEHTEDVLEQVKRIAKAEDLTDNRVLLLMKMAAIFHDSGFLRTYSGHESASCLILREMVDPDLLEVSEIELINGMIMATKIPQTPRSLPERIICDADLDYLGRNDFERISNLLKDEFLAYNVIKNEREWNELQVKFFESHKYFTPTSQNNRSRIKMKHLNEIKEVLIGNKLS